jgi:hypothetical protein
MNSTELKYVGSLGSALEYAREGRIEEWIHEYLLSDGNNKAFSDGLSLQRRYYIGPVEFPTSLLCRCCGPEENMRYRVNAGGFERKVAALMSAIASGNDLPPIMVNFANGELTLNDGNHRFEAYTRLGMQKCYAIIWMSSESDVAEFEEKYKDIL